MKEIEKYPTVRRGLEKYQIAPSVYHRWKRQLAVGVNASLINARPLKSHDLKRLEEESKKLKEVVLSQSLMSIKKYWRSIYFCNRISKKIKRKNQVSSQAVH